MLPTPHFVSVGSRPPAHQSCCWMCSSATKTMNIVQAGVVYKDAEYNENGAYGVMIYADEHDNLFYAKLPPKLPKLKGLNLEDLHSDLHGELIPPHHVYPSFVPEKFTTAPEPLPTNSYVKIPDLLRYKHPEVDIDRAAELFRHEAIACEVFKLHPHPNIAKFLGCQVGKDRIVGLCFVKYEDRLRDLKKSYPKKVNKDKCLEGIRCGIEHMHALGYVHNDISPYNIMFDDIGNAVIIDFDSCRPVGSDLGPKSGTRGFFVGGTKISEPKNDYYALEMIEKYLNEKI